MERVRVPKNKTFGSLAVQVDSIRSKEIASTLCVAFASCGGRRIALNVLNHNLS